jgi:hypothetical protein
MGSETYSNVRGVKTRAVSAIQTAGELVFRMGGIPGIGSTQSSLQSNWKASPGWKTSGTKTPWPLVCCTR